MAQHDPDEINRLVWHLTDLQETWENQREAFDWAALEALAQTGAHAYNEGAGPSFHSLALDAVEHREFHERFLGYLLQAGFDPFKLSFNGAGVEALPVIDHADLAQAATWNPVSERMRATLMELARARFEPLAKEVESGKEAAAQPMFATVEACAESIPEDLMRRIAPELVRPHRGTIRKKSVNPVEGYLSTAEVEVEGSRTPVG
jgi:hypothetical protein